MISTKWIAALIFTLLAGLSGCARRQSRPAVEQESRTVRIVEIKPADTDIFAEYAAQIFVKDKVEVRGRVAGHIEQKLIRPGQEVEAGQPLFILDLRPLKAQLQHAEGMLKQAQSELTLARSRSQDFLREADARVTVAQEELARSRQNQAQLMAMQQNATDHPAIEAAADAVRTAEASVRAARRDAERARLTTELQVQSAQGRVTSQSAVRDAVALHAGNGIVRAPVAGKIGDIAAQIGALADPNASKPLTTIFPLDPIWVRFHVSETQYLSFAGKNAGPADGGAPVQLILANKSVYAQTGHVVSSLKQVEPGTGTVELHAEFPNPRHWLMPGQFARVRYLAEHRAAAILAPLSSVLRDENQTSVFIVGEGNRIESRAVKVGARVGDAWLIDKGLQPGDRVVVESQSSIYAGEVVRPVISEGTAPPR